MSEEVKEAAGEEGKAKKVKDKGSCSPWARLH
jgi:hypothetical protein